MAIKIVRMMCPRSKWKIKCPYEMTPEYITVHNTYNNASAKAEISYMIGNNNETSYHDAIDDVQVVHAIDYNRNTWNAGDGNGKGNRKSISIEICYSTGDLTKFKNAEKLASKYIAYLLKQRGWGIEKVKKHQDWSGKYCPHRTLDLGWQRFLNMIKAELKEEKKPVNKPTDKKVNVWYKVNTVNYGWLPEVKNNTDYAGWKNSPITDLKIRVDKGKLKYSYHKTKKGYIDTVQVYYYTPDDIRPYKKAKYKVNNYPWQYDNETGKNPQGIKQDGYAGARGVPMTRFEIEIV